jgi:hypothetical protein
MELPLIVIVVNFTSLLCRLTECHIAECHSDIAMSHFNDCHSGEWPSAEFQSRVSFY